MDLKKKIRTFFTLSRRANGGFTLVELIVVIAILAILAGVGVPAYSGYVKKAEYAKDEALLAALNTAFASACAINGEDHYGRSDVSITLVGGDGAKTVGTVSVTKIPNFATSFATFYEGGTFKVFNTLYYSGKTGGFNATEIPAAYANLLAMITEDENFDSNKAAMLLSTFMTADGLGAEALMDQMSYLSGVSGNLLTVAGAGEGSSFYNMIYTGDFMDDLAVKMGYEDADGLLKEYGSLSVEERNVMLSNGLILSVAEQTATVDKTFLDDPSTIKTFIQNGMDSTDTNEVQTAFTQASLAYGMYMSYANSEFGNADAIANANNVTDSNTLYKILDDMNSDAYKKYMESDQYDKDLAGYTAAMNVINSASGDPAAVKNLVESGYNDPALIALFQQAMAG